MSDTGDISNRSCTRTHLLLWALKETTESVYLNLTISNKVLGSTIAFTTPHTSPHKAFDTVSQAGLWKITAKFGCPDKFIALVCSFHDEMQVCVQDYGESTKPVLVTNGVKQGCVLAPALFSMFSAMLTEAFSDNSDRILIKFRTDSKLFNLRRLHAKSKVKMDCVRDLLFADDCAVNASSEPEMQKSMDKSSSACNALFFALPSAQRKQKKCISQHPVKFTPSRPSLSMEMLWRLLINSPTLAASSPGMFVSMMKLF